MENLFTLDGTHIKSTYYVWTFPWYTLKLIRRMYSASKWAIWQKAIKKKLFLQIFEISKFFFVKSKFHVVSKTYPNFTLVRLTMPDWEHFEKKKFQKFQKSGKKIFPHKIPQGPPQAGPLCLGVFPSCHNTFHQIWSNSSFLPFPPLLYRLSEFTLNNKGHIIYQSVEMKRNDDCFPHLSINSHGNKFISVENHANNLLDPFNKRSNF